MASAPPSDEDHAFLEKDAVTDKLPTKKVITFSTRSKIPRTPAPRPGVPVTSKTPVPGEFPESFIEPESDKPWVIAGRAGRIGTPNTEGNSDPAFYSKAQYDIDCVLLLHLWRHRAESSTDLGLKESDVAAAKSLIKTWSTTKYHKAQIKCQSFKTTGKRHHWLTAQPDFAYWLLRYRAGPTGGLSPGDSVDENSTGRATSTNPPEGRTPSRAQSAIGEMDMNTTGQPQVTVGSSQRPLQIENLPTAPPPRVRTPSGVRSPDNNPARQPRATTEESVGEGPSFRGRPLGNFPSNIPPHNFDNFPVNAPIPNLARPFAPTTMFGQPSMPGGIPGAGRYVRAEEFPYGNLPNDIRAGKRPERNERENSDERRERELAEQAAHFQEMNDRQHQRIMDLQRQLQEVQSRRSSQPVTDRSNITRREERAPFGQQDARNQMPPPLQQHPPFEHQRQNPINQGPRVQMFTEPDFQQQADQGIRHQPPHDQAPFRAELEFHQGRLKELQRMAGEQHIDELRRMADDGRIDELRQMLDDQRANNVQQTVEGRLRRSHGPPEPRRPGTGPHARAHEPYDNTRYENANNMPRYGPQSARAAYSDRHQPYVEHAPPVPNFRSIPREERHRSASMMHEPRYKLKPTDLMIWDPKEHSASFFIDRFRDVADIEGDAEVLHILPRCLKGDALEWHTFLPSSTKLIMNRDLAEWERQIWDEFKPNESAAAMEAKRLKFQFSTIDEIPLGTYLRKKAALLRDSGIRDDAAIIQMTWDGLDRRLRAIVPIKSGESWRDFQYRVREHESSASSEYRESLREYRRNDRSNTALQYRYDTSTAARPRETQWRRRSPDERANRVEKRTYENPSAKSPPKPARNDRKPLNPTSGNPSKRPAEKTERKWWKRPCKDCGGDHPDCRKDRSKAEANIVEDYGMTDTELGDSDEDEKFLHNLEHASITSSASSSPAK